MASHFDEELNSINPTRLPPDRETAAAIFRHGMKGSLLGLGIGLALTLGYELFFRSADIELMAIVLFLEGLFIWFALWVRQKATLWPIASFVFFSTFFAVTSLNITWGDRTTSSSYRVLMSLPDLLQLAGQLLNFRALRYLYDNKGDFSSSRVPLGTTDAASLGGVRVSPNERAQRLINAPILSRRTLTRIWLAAGVVAITITVVAAIRFNPFGGGREVAQDDGAAVGNSTTQAAPSNQLRITDQVVRRPPSWDPNYEVAGTPNFCAGIRVTVVNETPEPLPLTLGGNESYQPLGTIAPSSTMLVSVAEGHWAVMLDDGPDAIPLIPFVGLNCAASSNPHDASALPEGSPFTADEERLVRAHADANVRCRQVPSPATDQACRDRDKLLAQMNARDICWGRVTEPDAMYAAHRCDGTSIR